MKIKKVMFIIVISLMPLIIGLLFYDKLPELIPTHFNLSGDVDGVMRKEIVVFGAPVLSLGITFMSLFMMGNDPKKENYSTKIKAFTPYFIPITISMFVCLSFYVALGNTVNINTIVGILLGLVFMFMGNYMPKVRQNYTMGIRTPWALNDSENWKKTHRVSGYIYFILGIVIIIFTLMKGNHIPLLVIIFIALIVPYTYSYMLYRQKEKDDARNH